MLKWLSQSLAQKLTGNPDEVRQRLQAAQRLVQEQKERKDRTDLSRKEPHYRAREIFPPDEPDVTIPYRPLPLQTGRSILAAALESILQGKRVSAESFTQLYRGGFVFKDPQGQWRITALGKELVEKHKLLTPDGCLVAGVKCAAGWNK